MTDPIRIPASPEEAAEAATAAAFTVTDPESSNHGRTLLHCRAGGFGADWDLAPVLEVIRNAREIVWAPGPLTMGHDLLVIADDGVNYRFEVKTPSHLIPPTPRDRLTAAITAFRDAAAGGSGDAEHAAGGELADAAEAFMSSATPPVPPHYASGGLVQPRRKDKK